MEAVRDKIAVEMDEVDPRYLAPLVRQLVDVMAKLDALPGQTRSTLDELAERRATRRKTKVAGGS